MEAPKLPNDYASALIQAPIVRGVGGMQALGGVCMCAAVHAAHGRCCGGKDEMMRHAVTRTRPIVVPTHGQ